MKDLLKFISSFLRRLRSKDGESVTNEGGLAIRGKDGKDGPHGRGGKGGSARSVGGGYARGGDGGDA